MIKSILGYLLILVLGVLVAVIGGTAHRAMPYFGLILSVVLVFAGAIFARTWKLWAGLGTFAGSWLVITAIMTQPGPGDSLLIVDDLLGSLWLISSAVVIVAASVIPTSLLIGRSDVAR